MSTRERLKYGMIGGGPGAFIGAVHRKAIALDGGIDLVAGAFSSDPERAARQGAELGLDSDRTYESYQEMAEREASRPIEDRLDFVVIVTPNFLHFPVAKTFVEAGFNVVCDKPLTTTLDDAERLCEIVREHGVVFAVTYNYTGYPMVKEARALVRAGRLGTVRKVVVEYSQGWLAMPLEKEGHKQASWRLDPERAGISSALGDIGSHAENLTRYITGLALEELCADVSTVVPGRLLEDDANVLLHFTGGAVGTLSASQISVGEENHLRIRVYGSAAALDWFQEDPNYLHLKYPDRPAERLTRGSGYTSPAAMGATRLPTGHPEGFIEGFANIYGSVARAIRGGGGKEDRDFPTVQDGATGVHFIETAVGSAKQRAWVNAAYNPPA